MTEMCVGPECDRQSVVRGLCSSHYQQKRKGRELTPVRRSRKTQVITYCPVPNCKREMHSRGLCSRHKSICTNHRINTDDYLWMYEQGCRNPNCDQTQDLQVDHDHACCPGGTSCGKCVRGLLCYSCNRLVMIVETYDKSPEEITGIREYLLSQREPISEFTPAYFQTETN